jgi:hypothetical protein
MKSPIQALGAYLLLLSTSLAIPKLRVQAAPASAIQVLMVQSDEIKLPAEFQISLYENLIQQLEKKGGFQHVYRDGDIQEGKRNGAPGDECDGQDIY